jgi:Domain of unknown function (DUF4131)
MVLASQPLPAAHVLSRIAAGQIELKTPLRWYGHLRSEPARLPWGVGLEMELSGVETAVGMIPVSGGMRMGFTPKEGEADLPEVHAGDEVSVMTQARLPLVFWDTGAFDRREYLAQQNIHLLATIVIATHPFPAAVERGALEVDVLDVAQGDSILVISPRGSTLLIDGGAGEFSGGAAMAGARDGDTGIGAA